VSQAIRLSKPFYLGVLVGVPLLLRIADVAISPRPGPHVEPSARTLILGGFELLVALGSAVAFLWFWYRAWKAIHLPESPNTPAERVLILLIPVVNVYWPFVAFRPWGKQYNEYLWQKNLPLPRVKEGVFVFFSWYSAISIVYAYVVGFLFCSGVLRGWTPPVYFSISIQMVHLAFIGLTTYYVCEAVNRLPFIRAELEPAGNPPAERTKIVEGS
jgi:hypothetical protein